MANEPAVEVVGAADAFAAVARAIDKVARAVDDEGRRAADRLVGLTVPKVPRLSGALAGSLAVELERGGAAAGYDGSVDYAGYIEFGGVHGRPYVAEGRYLYPTAEPVADSFLDDLEAITDEQIRRYRWPTPN